jgi:hypothetical protein
MRFTTKGRIRLYRGDRFVSQHTVAEEAYESAYRDAQAKGPGKYTVRYPDREIDLTLLRTVLESAPVGLSAQAVSASQINLAWTASPRAASYRVYRAGVFLIGQSGVSYSDSGLSASTQYSYAVSCVGADGQEGPASSAASATTLAIADVTAPSVPGTPSVVSISSSALRVAWSASTDSGGSGLAGYELERSANGTTGWAQVYDGAAATRDDSGLSASTTYYYRVRAYDGADNFSAYSSVASGATSDGSGLMHGGRMTITGSGFGTRGDYGGSRTAINYHNVDWNGASSVEVDGMNVNSGLSTHWKLVTGGAHSTRYNKWAKRHSTGASANIQYLRSSDNHSTGKFLAYVWHRKTPDANGKAVRWWHGASSNTDFWINLNGGNVASDSPQSFTDFGGVNEASYLPDNTWFPLLYLIQDSDLSTTQTIRIFKTGANSNNAIYTKGRTNYPVDTLINPAIGAGEDGPNENTYWGFSRVSIDAAWSSVWLCDTADFAARTKADYQPLLSWSDTSIQIEGRADSFAMNDTAYLHVLDNNFSPIGSAIQVTVGN